MNSGLETLNDIELIEKYWNVKSASSFDAYRTYYNYPKIKTNWFTRTLNTALQDFYVDFINGEKPILILEAPPQHGKSETVIDFATWLSGNQPWVKTIYAAFSERLGIKANKRAQQVFDSSKFQGVFPNQIELVAGKFRYYARSSAMIEYPGHEGYFRNTTTGGAITGETLDLGIIDDPVKGQEAANSPTIREKTWDWFQTDFYSRFSENAGLIIMLTRWNVEDLAGHVLKNIEGNVKRISFQSIAEEDEKHRKKGEALLPSLKSLEFLEKRKSLMHDLRWGAIYQQRPSTETGNIFKDNYWHWWVVLPQIKFYFIVADTAQKTNTYNDYTCLQAWGMGVDGCIYLLDMVRDRFEAPDLEKEVILFYKKFDKVRKEIHDPVLRGMFIEDKSSGSSLIQNLKRKKLKVIAVQRNVDKVSRGYDTAPFAQSGRVFLNEDVPHVQQLTKEARELPTGKFDDVIDTCMSAIEAAYVNRDLMSSLGAAMAMDQ